MFANTQRGGMAFAIPDVCLTPPVPTPIPYPNFAANPMAVSAVYKVLFVCAPAHNMRTTVPMTNGDNPGIVGGVLSRTVMSTSRHVMGARKVLIQGAPVTRLTSPTMQNRTNARGMTIVPSQTKVLILAP
jgi:Domain of unknown function (DUF4150)